MSRRVLTLLIAAVSSLLLVALAAVLPVPYVALTPGPVSDTLGSVGGQPLISVDGQRTYPADGHLYLTTVEVFGAPGHEPTLAETLAAWLDRSRAVVPQQVVYPPGQSGAEVEAENKRQMQESQQHAITAALRELHYTVTTKVAVDEVTKGSPADGKLRVGDVVAAVDGQPVSSEDQLRQLIGKRKPGQDVRLTVQRAGKTLEVTVGTIAAEPGSTRPVVGIVPTVRASYPFQVNIRLEDVGGPSAGLMFALGLIDRLTPGNLTGGKSVAGTGTIDDTGAVGPIGGIEQKVVAAARAGATVFLVPAGDCAGARKAAPGGIDLVRVENLQGALAALAAVRDGRAAPHC